MEYEVSWCLSEWGLERSVVASALVGKAPEVIGQVTRRPAEQDGIDHEGDDEDHSGAEQTDRHHPRAAEQERPRKEREIARAYGDEIAATARIDLVPDSVVRQRRSEAHAIHGVARNATEPQRNTQSDKEHSRCEANHDNERGNWSINHEPMLVSYLRFAERFFLAPG